MAEHKPENHIYIIGIGMGDTRNLTVEAAEIIEMANLLIGAKRMLAPYEKYKRCVVSYQTKEILQLCLNRNEQEQTQEGSTRQECTGQYAENTERVENIAVLMSGDSGFYSGTKALLAALEAEWGEAAVRSRVTVLPGIASLSYFSARIGKSWEDAEIVNLHGVQENLWQAVLTHEKVFAITGGNVQRHLQQLAEHGLGDVYGYVGENLSYMHMTEQRSEESCAAKSEQRNTEQEISTTAMSTKMQDGDDALWECISEGTVRELAQKHYANLAVLYLENPAAVSTNLWGLPDESFIRGEVPMTKAEVRAVVMSKLRIRDKDVVYDIGAGTGSVSVEMALAARKGKVYAIETNSVAIELCKLNRQHFCLHNMETIEGMAPEALQDLPAPDVAFIGGSKGLLREIVELLYRKNPAIRLVINTITVENTATALTLLESEQFIDVEMVQLQVSRAKKAGTSHMLTAQNPITILTARGKGAKL